MSEDPTSSVTPGAGPDDDGDSHEPPRSPVSDRVVGIVAWISALVLLTPVLIYVYVYWVRGRLLR